MHGLVEVGRNYKIRLHVLFNS